MANKSLFDHINAIYTNQRRDYFDTLTEEDRKSWSDYMINRFLSMNIDLIPLVNEVQQYYNEIRGRELYLVYADTIPKGKQFNKYIKRTKDEQKYEGWLIERISKHFMVGKLQAELYLDVFYKSSAGKEDLRRILEGYGVDSKRIKKAKL